MNEVGMNEAQMTEIEGLLRAGSVGDPPPLPALRAPEGMVDVSYAIEPTPVGRVLLAATARGLVYVAYLDGDGLEQMATPAQILQQLADRISPRVLERPAALEVVRRQLDEFFCGRRREFELQLDWQLTRGFASAVLRATAQIPFGEVSTYKGVATAAGSPGAFRAAGNALGSNPLPIIVPCHRVLHSGGGLGGYTGGIERKLTLLTIEGHPGRPRR